MVRCISGRHRDASRFSSTPHAALWRTSSPADEMQHHQMLACKTSEAAAPHGLLHSSLLTGPFQQLAMLVISEGLMGDPSDLYFRRASHISSSVSLIKP